MYHMSSLIWGIFILLFGISLVIQAVTGVSIPLARIFAGLFLVYLGYNLIFKNVCWWDRKHTYKYAQGVCGNDCSTSQKDYSVSFGSANIDLSQHTFEPGAVHEVRSCTSFGSTKIRLPKNVIIELSVNSNFAHVVLPDGTEIMTGTRVLRPTSDQQLPVLRLYIDVFCGEVVITA